METLYLYSWTFPDEGIRHYFHTIRVIAPDVDTARRILIERVDIPGEDDDDDTTSIKNKEPQFNEDKDDCTKQAPTYEYGIINHNPEVIELVTGWCWVEPRYMM